MPQEPPLADTPGAGSWSHPRRVLLAAVVAAGALLLWQLAAVMILVFGAVVLAAVLRGVAHGLERRLRVPARWSVLVGVLMLAALAAGVAAFVGDAVGEQLAGLRERLPRAWEAARGWLGQHAAGRQVLDAIEGVWDAGTVGPHLARLATLTVGAAGTAVLMLILAVYLAAEPRFYRRGLVRLVPPAHRPRVDAALQASGEALSRWLLGQGVSMLFIGAATGIGLSLLGAPTALTLGLIAGLLAFVPFFGAAAAGVLAVLLAFTEGPRMALYVALLFLAVQQVEEYLLLPFVQRWAVRLPPALGLVAAVIFGILFGPIGIIFATPLMVVTMVLVRRLYVQWALEHRPMRGPGLKRR